MPGLRVTVVVDSDAFGGAERYAAHLLSAMPAGLWRSLVVSLLAAMDRFAAIGAPVMLAASNKIFLGRLLGLAKDERETATAAACAAGVLRGARVLRVHSARIGRQAGDLAAALLACDGGR